ncbi:MAG: primosomal protein N' [Candidatus Mcinerneyibacterium aminivorans]|uniref:Replication restart protein PriA n=1 Tax=Candidatus Mcinerneyibacterium aminivorans TaxID=2703815 RepID=A0A5D0MK68_9BACT|nr:MAG: primosomal protein N' [Candidatus Mcinerneyibacterium aminivorans]
MFVSVVFKNIDKKFTYSCDTQKKNLLGARVIAPFKQSKKMGYIVEKNEKQPDLNISKIKNIVKVLEPVIPLNLFYLSKWISDYYITPVGKVLDAAYPPFTKVKFKIKYYRGKNFKNMSLPLRMQWSKEFYLKKELRKKLKLSEAKIKQLEKNNKIEKKIEYRRDKYKKIKKIKLIKDENILEEISNKAYRQKDIINRLLNLQKEAYFEEFSQYYSSLKSLEKKGIIKIYNEKVKKKEEVIKGKKFYNLNKLTAKQKKIYDSIYERIHKGFSVNYIYGITGSGKTEIYFHLIQKVLKDNKEVIYLVPEVALTTHLIKRLKNSFGDNVNLNHSYLKKDERYFSWISVYKGSKKISIGPRSAIFLPAKNLGLIIVDEEHESSYKQNQIPKYNGRDVAIMRAKKENIPVVLGSATPSLESFYNVKTSKKYNYYELSERYKKAKLPEVEIIDMKNKKERNTNFYPFSKTLINELKKRKEKNEQSIIFLNRKGYNTYLSCKGCGNIVECPHCSKPLTYYKNQDILKCHICEKIYIMSNFECLKCGSNEFTKHGVGTEKLEEKLKEIFTDTSIFRIDGSIVSKHKTMRNIFRKFESKEIDVLVGTQILAKGIDFENITFVGVVNSDVTMNIPDFRANERTFQLISQVAGRAGRGKKSGKVVIQTYSPNNYVIKKAIDHDFKGFYKKEINYRKQLGYPPIINLIKIMFINKNKKNLEKDAKYVRKIINNINKKNIKFIGPADAFMKKKNNYHRKFILIKGKSKKLINKIASTLKEKVDNEMKSKIIIDVDPYQMS